MRLVKMTVHDLWRRWTAVPPVACCPSCCINFANFR